MSGKTNKLTVGLVKAEFQEFSQIAKSTAESIEIAGIGTFYKEPSRPRAPSWITDFFGTTLGSNVGLISSSAKGVLLMRVPDGDGQSIFALFFGLGRHLLNDGVLEERYGLKVVLNSVDPDSLRSIDKTALGSVPKQSREQISREGGAANFGIDIEQDLVSSVTGRSRNPVFGRSISGRDTFATSAKINITNIREFLEQTLIQYRSDTYRERFDWIDQIMDVKSRQTIAELNQIVIDRLRARNLEQLWMVPPEIIEWSDVKSFRYFRKRSPDVLDLDLSELLLAAGDASVTHDWLTNSKIILISAKTDDEIARWPVYKCIYAEVEHNGSLHVLNAGKWYEVAKDFTTLVNDDFAALPESLISLPDYAHESETQYNIAATSHVAGSHCLDGDLIIHGGGQSRIEFCDILTPSKQLVHVKRYSGSQQMSHLFSQGVVSAELFVSDAAFRHKLNEKLPAEHRLLDAAIRPNPADYEVVFTVISKSANPLNLPFFSKVSLRNAARRLRGYGFRVSKKKVRAITNAA